MSIRLYEYLKTKYENTKPIRGRAVDIRPWDDRRRDKELIVQTVRVVDGQVMYGAKLYNTVVLAVDPQGNLRVDCGDWVTPSTSEYLHRVMGQLRVGVACKHFNAIWFRVNSISGAWTRVPKYEPVTVPYDRDKDTYIPPEQTVIKRSTDRAKMKELRAKAKPFVEYYRMFLKMSDGFVSAQFQADHTTKEQHYSRSIHITPSVLQHQSKNDNWSGWPVHQVFDMMCSGDDEHFPALLTYFARAVPYHSSRNRLEDVVLKDGTEAKGVSKIVPISIMNDLVNTVLKELGDGWTYRKEVITEPTKSDCKE